MPRTVDDVARWDTAAAAALDRIAARKRPDVAFVREALTTPAAWDEDREDRLRDVMRAAQPIKALRATLLAVVWDSLAVALAPVPRSARRSRAVGDAKRVAIAIPALASELGADHRAYAAQVAAVLAATADPENQVAVLRELIRALERDAPRPTLLRAYRAILAVAETSPRLLVRPPAALRDDVAAAVFAVIGEHVTSSDPFVGLALDGALHALLQPREARSIAAALARVAAVWSDATLAAFVRACLRTFEHADRPTVARRDAVLRAALPPLVARGGAWMEPPDIQRLLAKLKLAPRKRALALPATFPRDITDALALEKTYGTSLRQPPARASKSSPAELRELYRHSDGFGPIAAAGQLAKLQRRFLGEVRTELKNGEPVERKSDLDIRVFEPVAQLVAIGSDGGGDTFFIDPRRGTTVYRFVHDESRVVRPEAASIGAFIAQRILGDWAVRTNATATYQARLATERSRLRGK